MNKLCLMLLLLNTAVYSQQQINPIANIMANSFFDDGNKATASLRAPQKVSSGNYISGLTDDQTGDLVSFIKVTNYEDGSAMNDSKVDGVIYRKKGAEYFKRVYDGAVNVRWFGARGNARTDATQAIQKAIDLYDNVYIPKGQYQVSGIIISRNGVHLYGDGREKTILFAIGTQDFVLAIKNAQNPAALYENIHISDMKIDGGHRSKDGLYASIVSSLIERINVYSCTEYGILHYRGYTSTYRDCYVSYCGVAGLNVFQEGNLLLFESCLFSNNEGSGIIHNSGNTNMFLKCSIENNKKYGVMLSYQSDPRMSAPPYIPTVTGLITFMTCFFENNGISNRKQYANITFSGQPDPGPSKVRDIVIKGCHFGLSTNEVALDLHSDIRNVTVEDNLFAYNAPAGSPPIVIGSFYTDYSARAASNLFFRNNFLDKTQIVIAGASASYNKNAIADLLELPQKTNLTVNGLTFSIFKTGKNASIYINGISQNKFEQNINLSETGISLTTDEKLSLSNYNQNGILFETRPLFDGNIIRFGCLAGKTFNNYLITFPTQF